MEEDYRPSDTVPADSDVKPAEGGEKVSDVSQDEGGSDLASLSLEELNSTLGRQFKTKEGALKAIKDTYNFVGKQKQEGKVQEVAKTSNEEIETLKTELFFTQNPDLKDARPILEALAKSNGQTLQEAAESEVFQGTLSKIKGYDESQSKRTVMESNQRVASNSDKSKEFEAAKGDRFKMGQYVLKHHLKIDE